MRRIVVQPRIDSVSRYLDLADTDNVWFEAIEPGYPDRLDDLDDYFARYLAAVPAGRTIAVHGPYIDIVLHSPDSRIRDVSRRRVLDSLRRAEELGAEFLLLHTNHLPMIGEHAYDEHWLAANREFFRELPAGRVTVLLENMWDETPDLAVRLVEEVASERLRLCLDVAHRHVYGRVPLDEWLAAAGPWTPYVQLGDNDGDHDADLALGRGTVDWAEVDRALRRHTPDADVMVGVGIDDGTRLTASLAFLRERGVHPFGAPRLERAS